MSNMYQSFPAPILGAGVPSSNSAPYSVSEWDSMVGYPTMPEQYEPNPMSQQAYNRVFAESNPDRVVHPRIKPTTTTTTTRAPTSSNPPLIAALATWCGFSTKAMEAHTKQGIKNQVQELLCDKQDQNHPACKMTRGYPAYYKKEGNTYKKVHNGYTANPKSLL